MIHISYNPADPTSPFVHFMGTYFPVAIDEDIWYALDYLKWNIWW